MPFHYQYGGIDIASDIPLDRLRMPCPQSKTYGRMTILSVPTQAPAADEELFRWPGRFGMKLGMVKSQIRFETPAGIILATEDGSVIRMFANEPGDPLLTDLFVRRILPRLAKLMGGETYHAASLAREGRAILLFGPTGAGKSSMTIGLAATGDWTILGDDMALVRNDGADVAMPTGADIALWPSTSDALGLPGDSLNALSGYDGKNSYCPAGMAAAGHDDFEGYPRLAGLYFLSRTDGGGPSLEPLPRARAIEQALHQIVFLNPNGVAVRERVNSVTALSAMLKRVPAWSLTYPSSYGIYPEVSAAIVESLAV